MISYGRRMIALTFCFMIAVSFMGCQKAKPKQGKVAITKQEFSMHQENKYNWTIDASGKVKNVGDVPVKDIVVTGYCKSCGNTITPNVWSEYNVTKSPDQKAVIPYLAAGAEKDFSFKEVAFLMTQAGKKPSKMPKDLECKVISFKTIQK